MMWVLFHHQMVTLKFNSAEQHYNMIPLVVLVVKVQQFLLRLVTSLLLLLQHYKLLVKVVEQHKMVVTVKFM